MPEERDIEKKLRAWAKRRRDDAGAPLDLHPATRKLLQDEVARLKTAPRRRPGLFAQFLWGSPLRLALNLSALAVLIFAAAIFLPLLRQHPSNLSGNPGALAENNLPLEQNARPTVVEQDSPGNAPPVPPVEVAPTAAGATPTIAAPQPVPPAAARKAKTAVNSVALADNSSLRKTPVVSAAPGVARPVTSTTSATSSVASEITAAATTPSLDQEKLPARQIQTQTGAADFAVPSANQPAAAAAFVQKLSWANSPPIADRRDGADTAKLDAVSALASFRTEQSGNQFRVIDADGSVYVGSLTAATEILDSKSASRVAQTRAFRVTGTNLTRHEPVVFTGNLVFAAQSFVHGQKDSSGTMVVNGGFVAGSGGGGFGGAVTNRAAPQSGATPIPGAAAQTATVGGALPAQPQFRVEGTALIGTNEIQINAVPVNR